jgi:hypothetical protein
MLKGRHWVSLARSELPRMENPRSSPAYPRQEKQFLPARLLRLVAQAPAQLPVATLELKRPRELRDQADVDLLLPF